MHDLNDDGPYGHALPELRRSVIGRDLQSIELEREKRRGRVPKPGKRRENFDQFKLSTAFARAAREQRELQRLKAIPNGGLHFHPEQLGHSDGGESGNASSPR
jgi:hypothetical protein